MHTSWSEVSAFRQCARKHHLIYREGWVTKSLQTPLRRGSSWHAMLEALYKTGRHEAPAEVLIELLGDGIDDGRGGILQADPEDGDLLAWMLDGYYEFYGKGDPAWSGAKIRGVEMKFEYDLPDVGYGPLKLIGFIDLLIEMLGRLWIVDHKTGKQKPRNNDLALADQWTLYTAVLQEMGYKVFGSVHNYAKTTKLKREQTLEERFERKPIQRTAIEVKQVVEEFTVQAWMAKLGIQGNPRSPARHCYQMCSFEDVCIAGRKFGERMEESQLRVNHKQVDERINDYA